MTVHADAHTLVTLDESKRLVETFLAKYFLERLETAAAMDPSYARLWQSFERLFVSGGKRIRPYVTLLAYQAYANQDNIANIVPAAAAQEILHLAMLVHDDIIDRDRMRYGIANVSGQYDGYYAATIHDDSERQHYADSAGILAGDLLLSDAYELLAQCKVEPRLILAGQKILNEAVFNVVGGELLDTEAAFTSRELVRPLDIARHKTASYSFVSPLIMGAMFAGADEAEIETLRHVGTAIGIAYQLQDDILGMFGSSDVTGKSSTSDLAEGKYTYLVQLFYELAEQSHIEQYEQIAGTGNVTDDQAEKARALLIDSSAKNALETYMRKTQAEAQQLIEALNISAEHKAALNILLTRSVKRVK